MGATPKNFKTIGKDEGPPPLNSMECDHFLARGGVQPVRGAGPGTAGMIALEGMDLNVDDWHGIASCSFDWVVSQFLLSR